MKDNLSEESEIRSLRSRIIKLEEELKRYKRAEQALREVTERKRIEEAIKNSRDTAEFYNDLMAHNINNLNQGILGYMQLLLKMPDFPDKFKRYIEITLTQSEEISGLISNMHKLSTIQKREMISENIDVFEKFTQVTEKIKARYLQKIINVKHDLQEGRVIVCANNLISDVFENILDNAVKYNRAEKVEVEVSHKLSEDTKNWRIEFEDNGPGIPDDMKGKIFKQCERRDKNVYGLGLGLTLAEKIVEGYGGKIWVEDRVEGDYTRGSRFVALLPKGECYDDICG